MSNLENLDWQRIVKHLSSFATSAEAQDELSRIAPLAQQELAEQQFATTQEAIVVLERGERPFMESLNVFPTWYYRLEKQAQLKPQELKDARLFFVEALTLQKILKGSPSDWTQQLVRRIFEVKEPLSAIDQLITP